MIKPPELESDSGRDIWSAITAAETGDAKTLRGLLRRDPALSRAEYFYTHPVHFAVRSGHLAVVQLLLNEGVDPEWNSFHDGSLIEMARDRGHEYIARILEEARGRRGRISPGPDHPIHQAAKRGDVERVREFLNADPALLDRGDKLGGTPLHRAVMGSTFQWLERFRETTATNGVASACRRRRYFDGLRSSDLEKRTRALLSAVKWLVRW